MTNRIYQVLVGTMIIGLFLSGILKYLELPNYAKIFFGLSWISVAIITGVANQFVDVIKGKGFESNSLFIRVWAFFYSLILNLLGYGTGIYLLYEGLDECCLK
jgi:hypothetical protein